MFDFDELEKQGKTLIEDFVNNEIKNVVLDHMARQPWGAACECCGNEVALSVTVNENDGDLSIIVPVCGCQELENCN